MFDTLSERLNGVFRKLGGRAQLDEKNIQEGLREVRLALLEADVNFKVVKEFTDRVREACLGQDVNRALSPTQHLVQVVHKELVKLLGGEESPEREAGAAAEKRYGGLDLRGTGPHVIMMAGLQGSGKTTSAAKLANYLRKEGKKPYLAPADVYRPAAIDQLVTLARQLGVPFYASTVEMNPVDIARNALQAAKEAGCDVVLLDTAGRLHIDEVLMRELESIKAAVSPREILFVADAMSGQEAVTVAEAFNDGLDITGVVLTKMDGDARGGAALSIKSVTGKNVKFVGMGEKISELEVFHPDRIAGRILGMGDMLTLIEKAQGTIEAEEAEAMAKKLQKAEFDFEDFLVNMRRMKKLGSLQSIMKLIPGLGALTQKMGDMRMPEKELGRVEAIINSMTPHERRNPQVLNNSRKTRIAKGSGVSVAQVSQLVKQFEGMRDMMKKMMNRGKGQGKADALPRSKRMPKLPGGMPGLGGLPGMPGVPGMPGMPGMPESGNMPGQGLSKTAQKKKKQMRKAARKKKK